MGHNHAARRVNAIATVQTQSSHTKLFTGNPQTNANGRGSRNCPRWVVVGNKRLHLNVYQTGRVVGEGRRSVGRWKPLTFAFGACLGIETNAPVGWWEA